MSARLSFDPAQVDSIPFLLCAIHQTMVAVDHNAARSGMRVDWSDAVSMQVTRTGADVVINLDVRYVDREDHADDCAASDEPCICGADR